MINWHEPKLIDGEFWIDAHQINKPTQWIEVRNSPLFTYTELLDAKAGHVKMRLCKRMVEGMYGHIHALAYALDDGIFDSDRRCQLADTEFDFNAVWGDALKNAPLHMTDLSEPDPGRWQGGDWGDEDGFDDGWRGSGWAA